VRFTPSARLQFLEVVAYIRRDKPRAARAFRDKAQKVLRRLEEHPGPGRLIPEFPDLPHREVVVSPYRFFCRVEKKTVWVLAVWHGAQEAGKPGDST
jgi:plasmid stabilization system protein ParE